MAQHLAQVPDSVIGFVHQNEGIGIRDHTCGSGAIVVKFIHVGIIAAREAPALGACLTNARPSIVPTHRQTRRLLTGVDNQPSSRLRQ